MNHTPRLSERFRPADRIRKRSEYQSIHQHGKRFHSRQFVVFVYDGPSNLKRLGLVVTKKTGGAVVRNRWKRMIRELFRRRRDLLMTPRDHVVHVRRSVVGSPDSKAREELEQLFSHMGG